MKLNKFSTIKFLIFLIFPLFFLGAINLYQTGTIKNDGSGTMRIQYSAQESFLKPLQFTIGNFSFSQEIAKKNFESSNTTVKFSKLDYDVKDSTYYITVDVEFQDINNLSEAGGFSNVMASIESTDSGNVFKYELIENTELYKEFSNLSFIFEFESPVLSSNGGIEGNKVTWGSLSEKNTDFSNKVVLFANIKSNENDNSNEEKKSCGFFGFELPVLLLGGLILTYRKKKRNFNKNK